MDQEKKKTDDIPRKSRLTTSDPPLTRRRKNNLDPVERIVGFRISRSNGRALTVETSASS